MKRIRMVLVGVGLAVTLSGCGDIATSLFGDMTVDKSIANPTETNTNSKNSTESNSGSEGGK